MTEPETEWLTPAEVAVRLNVSRMAVYRLIHGGKLTSARITDRALRVHAPSVDAYLAKQMVRARLDDEETAA